MGFLTRLQMALTRFMTGRNGIDMLAYHLLWGGLILSIISIFDPTGITGLLSTAMYVYMGFRVLSRNLPKRQAENARWTQFYENASKEVRQFFLRLKGRKTHKYFRCPACKVRLRMKRGSGEKTITCPKCRHQFQQKA
ncbi:MAG: hypothetical protein IJ343_13700 [Clostridia bacterium]|nr:hypothetical protein [Clostridia bacterium]